LSFDSPLILSRTERKEILDLNLSPRELTTLAAAILFWREEMLPHGRRIMAPYFRQIAATTVVPLNRRELEKLAARFRQELAARE
jgi:hypothetical protein